MLFASLFTPALLNIGTAGKTIFENTVISAQTSPLLMFLVHYQTESEQSIGILQFWVINGIIILGFQMMIGAIIYKIVAKSLKTKTNIVRNQVAAEHKEIVALVNQAMKECIEKTAHFNSNILRQYLIKGIGYVNKKKYNDAVIILEMLFDLGFNVDRKYSSICFHLAQCHLNLNNVDRALECLKTGKKWAEDFYNRDEIMAFDELLKNFGQKRH